MPLLPISFLSPTATKHVNGEKPTTASPCKEQAPFPIPLLREAPLTTSQQELEILAALQQKIQSPTWKSTLSGIIEPSMQLVIGIGANLLTQQFMTAAGNIAENLMPPSTAAITGLNPAMLASLLGASTISSQVSETLVEKILGNKANRARPEWAAHVLQEKLTSAVIKASRDKAARLPDVAQSALRRFDKEVLTINECDREENLKRRQGILMAWPQTIIDISHQHRWGTPAKRQQIDAALKELMFDYPESVRGALRSLTDGMRSNCYVKTPKRVQAYLHGEPGTGKTRFVHQLVKALGLPLYTVNPRSNEKNAMLYAMEGPYADNMRSDDPNPTLATAIGGINDAFFATGSLNPVIFVDEAGELFGDAGSASALKRILDPEVASRRLMSFFGTKIDTSRATFLFAGNQPIADAALRSRMVQIEFASLGPDIKTGVLTEELDAIEEDNKMLPEDILENLCCIMRASLICIVDTDSRFKIAGIRDLKACARALTSVVRDTVMSGDAWSDADTAVFVEHFYAMQTGGKVSDVDATLATTF